MIASPERMLALRLAHSLGCTEKELRQRMGSREFVVQAAYDQLSPIGGERFDYLMAMMCVLYANSKSKKKFKFADFLPQWSQPPKKRTSTMAEVWAWARRCVAEQEKRERK